MVKKSKAVILEPKKIDAKTRTRAMTEHAKIIADVGNAKTAFVQLAARLAKMNETGLWRGVTDENHKEGYIDFDAYRQAVLGNMGKTKFYELIAVHQLSQGDHPLQQSTIKNMGVKRAYEVSRLQPNQRNAEILTLAQTAPLAKVKQEVQAILNEYLPKDKQKEPSQSFVRMLTPEIIARYEELEARAVWMEGICDHDPTLTSKQKFFLAMVTYFEVNHVEELKEADERKEQHESMNGVEAIHETTSWAGKGKIPNTVAP
jgi:hypothetical protein